MEGVPQELRLPDFLRFTNNVAPLIHQKKGDNESEIHSI